MHDLVPISSSCARYDFWDTAPRALSHLWMNFVETFSDSDFASAVPAGNPSEGDVQQHLATLRGRMEGDGSQEDGDAGGWQFARYNKEEWPKGPFRRNDVLIPLQSDSVDLWRGVDWQFVEHTVEQTFDTGGL